MSRKQLWNDFCQRHHVANEAVPLFWHDNLLVRTRMIGSSHPRPVLMRSPAMSSLILRETDVLVKDWTEQRDEYDGLIYMMLLADQGEVVPLYIGKAETIGKGDRNLSANIKGLHRDFSKFARWGDSYAYHIGDLSAAALPGHAPDKIRRKYVEWARSLFVEVPSTRPTLKCETLFWTKAWKKADVGIWRDFGPTRLTFLEYLLIGVASSAFPGIILNREGQNRDMEA